MLRLDNVKYAYEGMRFEFSMQIEQGSFLAIIGPSGAGKSTLLDLIAGFIEPASGTISYQGQSLTGQRPADRPVSMIFQENNLFAHLDVQTNIGLGISSHLKLSANDHATISLALQRVGLEGFANRLPRELSGGERQRVALARALVRERPLLLLDEPFAALGPALRTRMLNLVKELHEEKNLTTILVSHQPEDARSTASHTAFLNNGHIDLLEKTEKLFSITDNKALTDYQGS